MPDVNCEHFTYYRRKALTSQSLPIATIRQLTGPAKDIQSWLEQLPPDIVVAASYFPTLITKELAKYQEGVLCTLNMSKKLQSTECTSSTEKLSTCKKNEDPAELLNAIMQFVLTRTDGYSVEKQSTSQNKSVNPGSKQFARSDLTLERSTSAGTDVITVQLSSKLIQRPELKERQSESTHDKYCG